MMCSSVAIILHQVGLSSFAELEVADMPRQMLLMFTALCQVHNNQQQFSFGVAARIVTVRLLV